MNEAVALIFETALNFTFLIEHLTNGTSKYKLHKTAKTQKVFKNQTSIYHLKQDTAQWYLTQKAKNKSIISGMKYYSVHL